MGVGTSDKEDPGGGVMPPGSGVHHRCTVDLAIPRPVAPPQSRSPFHQVGVEARIACRGSGVSRFRFPVVL